MIVPQVIAFLSHNHYVSRFFFNTTTIISLRRQLPAQFQRRRRARTAQRAREEKGLLRLTYLETSLAG